MQFFFHVLLLCVFKFAKLPVMNGPCRNESSILNLVKYLFFLMMDCNLYLGKILAWLLYVKTKCCLMNKFETFYYLFHSTEKKHVEKHNTQQIYFLFIITKNQVLHHLQPALLFLFLLFYQS